MGRRHTLNFNNKEFWTKGNQIEDEQLIYEYEEEIGHRFPDSFIQFTKEFHNGTSKKHEHVVNEKMNLYLERMLSFNKNDEPFSIWEELYFGMTEFDPYVIIALDIGDNLIALDYSKSETEPSVVFVDHELLGMIFLEEDRDYSDEEIEAMEISVRLKDFPWAIFPDADSFLEFLNGLDGEVPYEPEEGEWYRYLDDAIPEINSDIKEIEEKIGHSFPKHYREIIIKYNDMEVRGNLIDGFNNDMEFSLFHSLNTRSRTYIMKYIERRTLNFWQDIIPFAQDIGNGYIAYDYSKDKQEPAIIFINFFTLFDCKDSIMDQYDKYIKLAENFEEFCNKMTYPPTVD